MEEGREKLLGNKQELHGPTVVFEDHYCLSSLPLTKHLYTACGHSPSNTRDEKGEPLDLGERLLFGYVFQS